jgi:hypothetical protein
MVDQHGPARLAAHPHERRMAETGDRGASGLSYDIHAAAASFCLDGLVVLSPAELGAQR